jgi:ribosomal protein S18 acetylase RimI-like enzyme
VPPCLAPSGAGTPGCRRFFLQVGLKHAHKGTLWGMYVRPAARGAGVGRRLVEAVMDYARPRVELIQLSVIAENRAARRLYARLGFAEYGVEKHAAKYQGRYHDDVLMAKMLAPEPESSTPPSGDRDR